jgi:hypothetical protein
MVRDSSLPTRLVDARRRNTGGAIRVKEPAGNVLIPASITIMIASSVVAAAGASHRRSDFLWSVAKIVDPAIAPRTTPMMLLLFSA